MSWSPYQSHADLLWCNHDQVPEWSAPTLAASSAKPASRTKPAPSESARPEHYPPVSTAKSRPKKHSTSANQTTVRKSALPVQRFNVDQLLGLVDALDNQQALEEERIIEILGARSRDGVEEYRRFLAAAGLVTVEGREWRTTEANQRLAIALRNEVIADVKAILAQAPSFSLFTEQLAALPIGQTWEPGDFRRATTTYRTLGEICCICAPIVGEGLFTTPISPTVEEFAPIALERFRMLDRGEGLVATGAWLEALIRYDGIHPEVARMRVNDASARRLLHRSTEGSTTEVRFDDHIIQVLRVKLGRPMVTIVHLFRGDYLIPGKSSSSLRIEEVRP